jgi:hypothetical protein
VTRFPYKSLKNIGRSVYPSNLFFNNLHLNDTNWVTHPNESTVPNIRKRSAALAYDISNFTILSIESIRNPKPIITAFSPAVGSPTKIFCLALSSIPNSPNTTNQNFEMYAASLSWALRLYRDDDSNYPGSPPDMLKSFLIIPIQFSTAAWHSPSWDTLPSDLHTAGTQSISLLEFWEEFAGGVVSAAVADSRILISVGMLLGLFVGSSDAKFIEAAGD